MYTAGLALEALEGKEINGFGIHDSQKLCSHDDAAENKDLLSVEESWNIISDPRSGPSPSPGGIMISAPHPRLLY